jgi:hypothetical protein
MNHANPELKGRGNLTQRVIPSGARNLRFLRRGHEIATPRGSQ